MKTLINLIVFLSLVSFTIFSCTKDDKNIEITDSTLNLDTNQYIFHNEVELDLGFDYTSPIVNETIEVATGVVKTFRFSVKFDLSNILFKQYNINTTDLYTREINFNGNDLPRDTLFIDGGTQIVSNYMYITQEPATNQISIYSHYLIPSFTFDIYRYNIEGTSEEPGIVYLYSDQNPLPPPEPNMPTVGFSNDYSPASGSILENGFTLDGQFIYYDYHTINCQVDANHDTIYMNQDAVYVNQGTVYVNQDTITGYYNTITGDYNGEIKVTYKLHYVDNVYPSLSRDWDVVRYADIENSELFMIKKELLEIEKE